jgi:hypothetical protein
MGLILLQPFEVAAASESGDDAFTAATPYRARGRGRAAIREHVDIWHCDALGVYSDVENRNGSTRGQQFLRGYQVSDRDGVVRFTPIYPGWYRRARGRGRGGLTPSDPEIGAAFLSGSRDGGAPKLDIQQTWWVGELVDNS